MAANPKHTIQQITQNLTKQGEDRALKNAEALDLSVNRTMFVASSLISDFG
jgi:hypothetical protein